MTEHINCIYNVRMTLNIVFFKFSGVYLLPTASVDESGNKHLILANKLHRAYIYSSIRNSGYYNKDYRFYLLS